MVKFGIITKDFQSYTSVIPLEISSKIEWYYQWYTSVFQWYMGCITSGIPVDISGKICWILSLLSTDKTMEISGNGITTVL